MTAPSPSKTRTWLVIAFLGVLFALAKIAIRALDDEPGETIRPRGATASPRNVATKPAARTEGPGGEIPAESRAPRDPERGRAKGEAPRDEPPPKEAPAKTGPLRIPVTVRMPDGTCAAGATVRYEQRRPAGPAGADPSIAFVRVRDTAIADENGAVVIEIDALARVLDARLRATHGTSLASAAARIRDESPVELRLEPAARVAGRVVDDLGAPVPAADLELSLRFNSLSGTTRVAARSSDDGSFDLGPVVTAGATEIVLDADAARHLGRSLPLTAAEAARPISVVLDRGRALRFRVIDDADRAIHGMTGAVGPGAESPERFEGGAAVIPGISVASTWVLVQPDPEIKQGVAWLLAPAMIAVPAGTEDLDLGEIRLAPGGWIEGTVRDAAGAPVAGARVTAVHPASGTGYAEVRTGGGGAFRLAGLLREPQELRATTWNEPETEIVLETRLRNVAPDLSGVDLRFTGKATVELRFLRAKDREPVSVVNARITAHGSDAASEGLSWNWDGSAGPFDRVRFEIDQPGTYRVDVAIPGYTPATIESLTVVADRETPIEILFRDEAR